MVILLGVATKRSVIKHGRYSKAIVLPAQLHTEGEVTLVGSRFLLVDLYGITSKEKLLRFYEKFVMPKIYEELLK